MAAATTGGQLSVMWGAPQRGEQRVAYGGGEGVGPRGSMVMGARGSDCEISIVRTGRWCVVCLTTDSDGLSLARVWSK